MNCTFSTGQQNILSVCYPSRTQQDRHNKTKVYVFTDYFWMEVVWLWSMKRHLPMVLICDLYFLQISQRSFHNALFLHPTTLSTLAWDSMSLDLRWHKLIKPHYRLSGKFHKNPTNSCQQSNKQTSLAEEMKPHCKRILTFGVAISLTHRRSAGFH